MTGFVQPIHNLMKKSYRNAVAQSFYKSQTSNSRATLQYCTRALKVEHHEFELIMLVEAVSSLPDCSDSK